MHEAGAISPAIELGRRQLDQLAKKLSLQSPPRAAIVGPHGSGKSTLLSHLLPLLGHVVFRRDGAGQVDDLGDTLVTPARQIVWLTLRRPTAMDLHWERWPRGSLLAIDGFEQLSRWGRWRVRTVVASRGVGLLVTSHRPLSRSWFGASLPTLIEMNPSPQTVRMLVERLLATDPQLDPSERSRLVDERYLARLLREEQGSIREVFMRLYDDWEACKTRL